MDAHASQQDPAAVEPVDAVLPDDGSLEAGVADGEEYDASNPCPVPSSQARGRARARNARKGAGMTKNGPRRSRAKNSKSKTTTAPKPKPMTTTLPKTTAKPPAR